MGSHHDISSQAYSACGDSIVGEDSMAWVEDVSKRTQKAKHYHDFQTGKWQAVFTIHDQHYKDAADQWQDVDESIVDDGLDGFDKKCNKTRHQFRIASGGKRRWYPRRNVDAEYVEITGIQYFDGTWKNLNLPAAVWKSQGAEWDLAFLYASITNTWRQIKTDFILKNSSAYTRLRFQLGLTGLTYNHTTGELISTTDGLVWGYITKPVAHDANDIDVPVSAIYDGTYIEWSVDTTGATFPIAIDPTFTDGYGGDVSSYIDTHMRSANADNNYGTATTFYIGEANFGAQIYRTLIKFDFSGFDGTETFTSVSLSLWHNNEDYCSNATTYYVYRQKRAWVEAQATWNIYSTGNSWQTAGGFGADDCEQTDIGSHAFAADETADTEHIFPISATNKAEADLGNGWMIKSSAENNDAFGFYSSDHATTGYRPKLVVEYTTGSGLTINLDPA